MIDRLTWKPIAAANAKALAGRALFSEGDPRGLESVDVSGRSGRLPFYNSIDLFHLELQPKGEPNLDLFVLANDDRTYVLDGTAQPIHQANAVEGVQVTEQTAADYLRFFCFAVRGDEGPFLLFEKAAMSPPPEDPKAAIAALAGPLVPSGGEGRGPFLFRVAVKYATQLFNSVFSVSHDGNVVMVDDDPVADDVPHELFVRLPELYSTAEILGQLESAGSLTPTGAGILRVLVELLLAQALGRQMETRLLAHFNARLEDRSPLDRFAQLVTTAAAVVAIESTLPFVEETVAQIAQGRTSAKRRGKLIYSKVESHDDTRLRVEVPDSGPGILLLPFHSYRGIIDSDRVAHELASREVACLIGCERVGDLPASVRQVIDLTLRLPRLDVELFDLLFRRVMRGPPPEGWADEGTHWVTHVHHSDFQHPAALGLSPDDAVAYIRDRARQRLRDVESTDGLGLRQLHGLGEARIFAEDLITDIHQAVAGRLDWRHVDRGVLLVGAPGTGKTTLARAIAKDCGIRFVNASAASWQAAGHLGDHIRAMRADFAMARRFAPAILFIDEIDSIGNRENFAGQNAQYMTEVVNSLLELLQGMDPTAPVIVIAATNHRDRVDPALQRAGRLDRVIEIPRPNVEALSQIFQHYLEEYAKGEQASDVDVHALAGLSLGNTGADVEFFVRGATRRARRAGRMVGQADLLDEITAKPRDPGSSPRLTPDELRRVAVHEAGHALASYLSSSMGKRIGFVSIVPRSDGSLGFVANLASNRMLLTRAEYLENIEVILAGRAAEEIVFGEDNISGGAGGSGRNSDLAVATNGALQLVSQHGLGPDHDLLWSASPEPPQLRQSEELLRACYKSVLTNLWQHVATLERLAESLIEHQELTGEEVRRIIDPSET